MSVSKYNRVNDFDIVLQNCIYKLSTVDADSNWFVLCKHYDSIDKLTRDHDGSSCVDGARCRWPQYTCKVDIGGQIFVVISVAQA